MPRIGVGIGLGIGGNAYVKPIPLQFSPVLWINNTGYKQTVSGSAAAADGDPVGEWVDQSGNTGRNPSQATAGKRGTLKLAIQNGLSVVRFDGISQYLATATFTLNQPFTRYSVFQQRTYTNGHIFQAFSANCGLYQDGVTPRLSMFAGSANAGTTAGVVLNTFHVLAEVYNGASSFSVLDNGAPSITGNPGANNPSGLTIAAFGGGGSNWTAIDVGELAMYNTAHAAGTISTISAYLKSKWGTP